MWRRAIGAGVVLLGIAAAQPSWKTPGACVTPKGSLCRTLVYDSSGWANRSWGFHNVERYADRITEAARGDGSALVRIVHRSYRYYAVPSERYDRSRIVLPGRRQTLEVEHSVREVHDLGGVWTFSEWWTDETDCSRRATLAGEKWRRNGTVVVGGVRAVEYIWETPDRRVMQRIAFAPSLGCTAVEFTLSERSAAGFPISEDHLKLVSASLTDPPENLFVLPAGYRIVGAEKSWPYIWMDRFPGSITSTAFSPVVP